MEYPQTLYQQLSSETFSNSEPRLVRRFLARVIDYQLIFILFFVCDFFVEGLITTNIHWFLKQVYEIPSQPMTLILLSLLFVGSALTGIMAPLLANAKPSTVNGLM